MKRILIACGVITAIFIQTIGAQDNIQSIYGNRKNQSIYDNRTTQSIYGNQNNVYGNQKKGTGLNMGGIFDIQSTEAGPGDPSEADPAAEIPVDGGIGILLAAGLGYGVRRLRRRGKANV